MWFSSLWTLQEAFLRKDALMLPVSGEKITVAYNGKQNDLTLGFLISICNTIQRHHDDVMVRGPWKVSVDIQQWGLDSLGSNNPLVLLRAARRRQCTVNRDRIIGIMQVFGMKLDKPGDQYQLEELQEKLSLWINNRSPALAQAFIQTCPEDFTRGRSWQARLGTYTPDKTFSGGGARKGIDETMRIPEDMYDAQEVPCDLRGSILFQSSQAVFRGHSFALESLLDVWRNTETIPPPNQALSTDRTEYTNSFACSVYLDNTQWSVGVSRLPVEFSQYEMPLNLVGKLCQVYPQAVRVFILGRVSGPRSQTAWVGMIVGTNRGNLSTRVGFCTWRQNPRNLESTTCFIY
jgi:hypothetical protein